MTARPDGAATAVATAGASRATAATRSLRAKLRGKQTCSEVIGPSERKSHRNGSARSTMDWSRTSVNQSKIRAHLEGLVIPALPVQSAQRECRGKAKGMPREGVE